MLPYPAARGSRNSETAMNTSPRIRPTLSPSLSSSGPTASEAIISPSACAVAMVPFWVGERWKRSDSSGRMVPSMAAIIP